MDSNSKQKFKKFGEEFKQLALSYTPDTIVNVGDVVETIWGNWKKSHRVKIYEIGIQLVELNPRARTVNETTEHWLSSVSLIGVDLFFLAPRLKKDGSFKDEIGGGIVLSNLTATDGKTWKESNKGFNHCGLSWTIDRLLVDGSRLTVHGVT